MGVMNRRMIKINPEVAKTAFRLPTMIRAVDGYSIEIFRLPTRRNITPAVVYDAFAIENGTLVFYWDKCFYELPDGQYVGVLMFGCDVCDTVNFLLGGCGPVLDSSDEVFSKPACASLNPGVTNPLPPQLPKQSACLPASVLCEGATIPDVERRCAAANYDGCPPEE